MFYKIELRKTFFFLHDPAPHLSDKFLTKRYYETVREWYCGNFLSSGRFEDGHMRFYQVRECACENRHSTARFADGHVRVLVQMGGRSIKNLSVTCQKSWNAHMGWIRRHMICGVSSGFLLQLGLVVVE